MRINPSEIWNNYEELMLKNALENNESPEIKKYKKDSKPRVSSDKEGTTQYNTKPESAKGMEYKINIIELAHPKPVIIAPSYDAINGLVENENERANIIRQRIINSPLPSGSIILQKLAAHKELSMNLIRIANDADNQGMEEIRQLADDCLAELQKEAGVWDDFMDWAKSKLSDVGGVAGAAAAGAGVGAAVSAILGSWTGPGEVLLIPAGAVIGGLLGALGKTGPQVQNIQINTQKVLDRLTSLQSDVPEQADFFEQANSTLNKLINASNNYTHMIDGLELRPHETTEAENQERSQLTRDLKDRMGEAIQLSKLFDSKAARGEFAKGGHSSYNPIYWFKDDEIEAIRDAFTALLEVIRKFQSTMNNLGEVAINKATETSAPTKAAPSTDKITLSPEMLDQWKKDRAQIGL